MSIEVERETEEQEEAPRPAIIKREGGNLYLRYQRNGDIVFENAHTKIYSEAKKKLRKIYRRVDVQKPMED